MRHPNEPDPITDDSPTVTVVFRWFDVTVYGASRIILGVAPYRRRSEIGDAKEWYAPKKRCRLLEMTAHNRLLIPPSLINVYDFALQQPNHKTKRWFVMVSPREADWFLKHGVLYGSEVPHEAK